MSDRRTAAAVQPLRPVPRRGMMDMSHYTAHHAKRKLFEGICNFFVEKIENRFVMKSRRPIVGPFHAFGQRNAQKNEFDALAYSKIL